MHKHNDLMKVDEAHITSLIVHAKPENVSRIALDIDAMPHAEVHVTSPEGKLVISLETDTLYQVTEAIDAIAKLSGVLSSTMVCHHVEDPETLDDFIETDSPLNNTTNVPEFTQ